MHHGPKQDFSVKKEMNKTCNKFRSLRDALRRDFGETTFLSSPTRTHDNRNMQIIQRPGIVHGLFARERQLPSTNPQREACPLGNKQKNALFPIARGKEKDMVINEMMKHQYHENLTGNVIVDFQDNHEWMISNKTWETKEQEEQQQHNSVNDKKRNAKWRITRTDDEKDDLSQRASTTFKNNNRCCKIKVNCSFRSSSLLQTSKSSTQFGCEEDDLMVFFRQYESENDLKICHHDAILCQHLHNKTFANTSNKALVNKKEKHGTKMKKGPTLPIASHKNNKVSDGTMPFNILDDSSSNDLLAGMTIVVPAPKRRNALVYYVGKFLAPPTHYEHHHDSDDLLFDDSYSTMQCQEYFDDQSDFLCFLTSTVRKDSTISASTTTKHKGHVHTHDNVMTSLISLNNKSDENCDYCSKSSPYYDDEDYFSDCDDCLLHHHDIEEPQRIS